MLDLQLTMNTHSLSPLSVHDFDSCVWEALLFLADCNKSLNRIIILLLMYSWIKASLSCCTPIMEPVGIFWWKGCSYVFLSAFQLGGPGSHFRLLFDSITTWNQSLTLSKLVSDYRNILYIWLFEMRLIAIEFGWSNGVQTVWLTGCCPSLAAVKPKIAAIYVWTDCPMTHVQQGFYVKNVYYVTCLWKYRPCWISTKAQAVFSKHRCNVKCQLWFLVLSPFGDLFSDFTAESIQFCRNMCQRYLIRVREGVSVHYGKRASLRSGHLYLLSGFHFLAWNFSCTYVERLRHIFEVI